MNPGLVVKLRPTGPWRIGPDSGARNRVDLVYHSDSLYSAITSAMARLGSLDEWLDATARQTGESAVCFSSCFPFLDEIGFIVPPRTVWPPTSPAAMSARVRWKSARFVPLSVVQAVLAGKKLDERQWSVDGVSQCLVPAGRPGPFRTSVRWGAGVDRLTGSSERWSTACTEFRPGAGLWTIVSFSGEAARERWSGPVKAAFRLLADSGFGGERSRGWGRAEAPEFVEGSLPEMILPAVTAPEPVAAVLEAEASAPSVVEPLVAEAPAETAVAEAAAPAPEPEAAVETPVAEPVVEAAVEESQPEVVAAAEAAVETPPAEPSEPEPVAEQVAPEPPAQAVEPPALEPLAAAVTDQPAQATESLRTSHWLLSLFAPAADDAVEWSRGNYALVARGGRVDSPAGSGELKKQIDMVTEGSVLVSGESLHGAAPDVAPEGFAHPVFRAGFALSIPLPGQVG